MLVGSGFNMVSFRLGKGQGGAYLMQHSKLRRGVGCINLKADRVDRNTLRRGSMEISPASDSCLSYIGRHRSLIDLLVDLAFDAAVQREDM